MTCNYENERLKEKKIEKISKILIRKIFSIRFKSTPKGVKPKRRHTTHTPNLSLRETLFPFCYLSLSSIHLNLLKYKSLLEWLNS